VSNAHVAEDTRHDLVACRAVAQVVFPSAEARRQMLASFAPSRLGPAVDGQGVTNEQATGYANLTYGRVRTRRSCGPSSIRSLIVTRPSCRPRSANWTP
jgi:hypothetical protein